MRFYGQLVPQSSTEQVVNTSKNEMEEETEHTDDSIDLWHEEEQHMVTIELKDGEPLLELCQYPSSDARWGIHSTIWDGGLALIHYLSSMTLEYDLHVDLGSGTGLVGLGAYQLSQNRRLTTILTDLPQALPLLQENVDRMVAARGKSKAPSSSRPPQVHSLVWGETIDAQWLADSVSAAKRKKSRGVLITGSDIIYRPSLQQPLLSTLTELTARLVQLKCKHVECLLACQSQFEHVSTFLELATKQGFAVEPLAIVRLDPQAKTCLAKATMERITSFPTTTTSDNAVWIVRIRKLPYTFVI